MIHGQDPKQVLRSQTQGPRLGTGQSSVAAAFWRILSRWTAPKRSEMAVGFSWVDARGLATILDKIRTIFADLERDRSSET